MFWSVICPFLLPKRLFRTTAKPFQQLRKGFSGTQNVLFRKPEKPLWRKEKIGFAV